MGQYLSSPVTDKEMVSGSTDRVSYGISAHQGWRKNMEDAHIVHHYDDDTYIFGVFDGHGGAEVAHFCAKFIQQELTSSADFAKGNYESALINVFHRMDDLMRSAEGATELESIRRSVEKDASGAGPGDDTYAVLRRLMALQRLQQGGGEGPAEPVIQAGCTAVVALVRGRKLFVANAGDSRAVLCRRGEAVALSVDHKPSTAEERARIQAAGGFVSDVGGITRVNGNLNLSRAIGDLRYKANASLLAKDQIISAEPDVRVVELCEDDAFAVLACDGIWDVMDNQTVVGFVSERLRKGLAPADAAAQLLDACMAADPREARGIGCDNMTASVIVFKHPLTSL